MCNEFAFECRVARASEQEFLLSLEPFSEKKNVDKRMS